LLSWDILVSSAHPALHLERTANRIHDGGKLNQNPVAGCFHDPTPVQRNSGIDQLAAELA
jgi:hypothetical protein